MQKCFEFWVNGNFISIIPFIIPQCFEITHEAYIIEFLYYTDGLQVNSFYHSTNTVQYTGCKKKGLQALGGRVLT
jgi:hypothetical protein